MSKGSRKIGNRQVLTKRLGVAAAVLIMAMMVLTAMPTTGAVPELPVELGSAGDFAILSKAGITNTGATSIVGDIGTSPITGAAIDTSLESQVTGIIYTVDAAGPAGSVMDDVLLTAAIGDMELAYTDAAARGPGVGTFLDVGTGTLSGLTLTPGVYTWGTAVTITNDIYLSGSSTDVWIFQISGTLDIASGKKVILLGDAQVQNIFWAVSGVTTLGTYSIFEGTILTTGTSAIVLQTGAVLNGRALSDGEVTLDANAINVNVAPVLGAIGAKSVNELVALTFTATATDSDIPVQTLAFSLVDAPAGASIGPSTGVFSWTPSEAQGPGVYTFSVVVSDGSLSDSETITVTVAEWEPAVLIKMNGAILERVGFANHTDDPDSGNWIVLSNGTDVTLPSIKASYTGVNSTSFVKNGKNVEITSTFTDKTVVYPFPTHQVYLSGGTVVAELKGEDGLSDCGYDVTFRLVPGTISDWKDAYTDLITGADMTKLKGLLDGGVANDTVFDEHGDASASFKNVDAGDYVLVALHEAESDPEYSLVIFSFTPVEVLDYGVIVTHDASVDEGRKLDIGFSMDAGDSTTSYRYGAVMIRSSVYDVVAELNAPGNLNETTLYVNGELMLEGEGTIATGPAFNFVGFDLDNINTTVLTTMIADMFGADKIAIAFSDSNISPEGQVSITTVDMPTGEYILLSGVWETETGNKLVAFSQSTVRLTSSTDGGGTPPTPPTTPTVEELAGDTPAAAADALEVLDPEVAATLLEQLAPDTAANILEEMTPEAASQILVAADPVEAASILEEMTPEAATQVLEAADPVEAAMILEETSPEAAAKIVEAAVDDGSIDDFVQILIDMQDMSAATVLNEVTPEKGAKVIEAMANLDLEEAAKTVEESVKMFTKELDPATKAAVMAHVKATLADVSVDTLVKLFIEIANLPATPSTVAAVFEVLEPSQVMNVVTGMGVQGAWSELGKIFSYLTQTTLDKIYTAMTLEQRTTVSPYLTAQTVALLPKLGTFTTSNLAITPASVKVGDSVTITAKVSNTGTAAGSYDVVLKVNAATEQTKTVSLNAGESTLVSFTVTKSAAATYNVAIDALTGSFVMKTPAAFTVSNLQISKTEVAANAEVTISATVSNTGDMSGSYTLSVKLDGVEKFSEAIALDGKASTSKTYTLSSGAAGQHTVTVDGLSVQFTVKTTTTPPTTPDYTWYIVGGVIVIAALAAVYFFYLKKKKSP